MVNGFPMAGELPPGFTVDEQASDLPAGFTIDEPRKPKTYVDWKGNLQVMSPQLEAGIKGITEQGFGSGIPRFAYDLGGNTTDLLSKIPVLRGAPAAAIGTGANFLAQAVPALFGGSLAAETATPALQTAGKTLMREAVKVPKNAALNSDKGERAINTLLEEGYNPTEAGVNAMRAKAAEYARQVGNILAPSKKVVSVAGPAQNAAAVADKIRLGTQGIQDAAPAEQVVSNLYAHPNVNPLGLMSVQDAQAMKQANYKSLGDAAYGLGLKPAGERDAVKAVSAGLRKVLESAHPEIAAPNAKAAELLNAAKISEARAVAAANANPVPMGPGLSLAFNNPWAALGLWGNTSSTAKALLARGLYNAGKAAPTAGFAGGAYLGAQSGAADEESRQALIDQLMKYVGAQ